MVPCLLTSTDCQTRRARCQHQLSFLLSDVSQLLDEILLKINAMLVVLTEFSVFTEELFIYLLLFYYFDTFSHENRYAFKQISN